MKHIQQESPRRKLEKWLELCDFSFDLYAGGFQGNPEVAEKKALRKLHLIRRKKSLAKQGNSPRLP